MDKTIRQIRILLIFLGGAVMALALVVGFAASRLYEISLQMAAPQAQAAQIAAAGPLIDEGCINAERQRLLDRALDNQRKAGR